MKFSFIILHYNTFEETSKCIEYVKKLSLYNESKLIVVDNSSTDNSLSLIKKKFENQNIDFIASEYNTGFAKGNNLGYSIAKHKYNSEYIICMNSDVYIKQNDFLNLIEKEYKTSEFSLLGPAIYTKDGNNQNPVEYIHDTDEKIKKTLWLNKLRYIKTFIPNKIKRTHQRMSTKIDRNIGYQVGVPLHGACIIAGTKFIHEHEYLFYPDTFLYGEEDIVYFMSNCNNEKLVYSSVLEVFHDEDASTNNEFGVNNDIKKRFILKNSNKSLRILRNLMKKNS